MQKVTSELLRGTSKMGWKIFLMSVAALGALGVGAAYADTIIYISGGAGNDGSIGQVDINTQSVVPGSVHAFTGLNALATDIAFNSTGTLYATNNGELFQINPNTGAATFSGTYGVSTGQMDALVGSGGTNLLGATANDHNIYTINPASPANPPVLTTSPAFSAGDLAWVGNTLYESAVGSGGNDELVNVTNGTVVGPLLTAVFGLAGTGGTLYAFDGTDVYSVNPANAVATLLFDYSLNENGQNLGNAEGAAVIGEGPMPVPAPLLGHGLLVFLAVGGVLFGSKLLERRREARLQSG